MNTYADPAATVNAAFDALEKRYQALCADVQTARQRRELQAAARVVISAYEQDAQPVDAPPEGERPTIGISPLWEYLVSDPIVEDEQPKRKHRRAKGKAKPTADEQTTATPRPASPVWWIGLPPTPKPARVSILQGLAALGDWDKPADAPRQRKAKVTPALPANEPPKKRGRPRKNPLPAEVIPAA